MIRLQVRCPAEVRVLSLLRNFQIGLEVAQPYGGRTRADKIGVGAVCDICGTDFSCIVMARQFTGPTRQSYRDHVGVMSVTTSINTPARCAEQLRTRLPCGVRCFVASLEKIGACTFVRLCNRSLLLLDNMSSKYDIVTLTVLMESRPCLWDTTSEEFKDRELKNKFCLEVCSFLKPDFLQLDRKERMNVGKYYKLIFIMCENVLQGPLTQIFVGEYLHPSVQKFVGPGSSVGIATGIRSGRCRVRRFLLSRQVTLLNPAMVLEEGCVCVDLVTHHKKRYTCAHYTPVLKDTFFAYPVVC